MRRRPPLPGRHGQRKHRRTSRLLALEPMEERVLLAPMPGITVTTTSDTGPGMTLRDAITAANESTSGTPTTIDFDVAQAAGTATISNGMVASLAVTNAGGGYSSSAPPVVTLSGGGGSGATATATVTNGVVTSFNIVNPGVGYSTSPAIILNPGTAPFEIQPASALPTISAPVIIDGTSQPGYMGTPIIQIDGTSAGSNVSGLDLSTPAVGSTIEGLDITNFAQAAGILIDTVSVQVVGNYIGFTTTGTAAPNNLGVFITASGNTVGGTTAASRNVLSGNRNVGVAADGSSNVIEGNYIGTNPAGSGVLPNGLGVAISGADNTIGGAAEGAGNVISGNTQSAVFLSGSASVPTTGNLIEGNFIGTDATGTLALGNGVQGTGTETVEVFQASNTPIGGTTAATRNVISGNMESGVFVQGTFRALRRRAT